MENKKYFKTMEIGKRAWLIEYGFTDQEHVYAYLIEGENYALVIDTMYGYGNLRALCETLTEKPLKLVNTHFHFDHCAGNFDFDCCYMDYKDIASYNNSRVRTPEQMMEAAQAEAYPELRDEMKLEDFCKYSCIPVYPLCDGDEFDLGGGHKIHVVEVGGHSAGSIVLVDPTLKIAFTGDACNGNTLLLFPGGPTVEEYLVNLIHLKQVLVEMPVETFYGGHQVLDPSVVEEGIELCAKVIAGTDDQEKAESFFGVAYYGGIRKKNGPGCENGKEFNIAYIPSTVHGKSDTKQVIR